MRKDCSIVLWVWMCGCVVFLCVHLFSVRSLLLLIAKLIYVRFVQYVLRACVCVLRVLCVGWRLCCGECLCFSYVFFFIHSHCPLLLETGISLRWATCYRLFGWCGWSGCIGIRAAAAWRWTSCCPTNRSQFLYLFDQISLFVIELFVLRSVGMKFG